LDVDLSVVDVIAFFAPDFLWKGGAGQRDPVGGRGFADCRFRV